jgi:hypothetical protein
MTSDDPQGKWLGGFFFVIFDEIYCSIIRIDQASCERNTWNLAERPQERVHYAAFLHAKVFGGLRITEPSNVYY